MSLPTIEDRVAKSLAQFSLNRVFPDDEEASAKVDNAVLPAALLTLGAAKAELENEIRAVSRDSAPNVDQWIADATNLQADIEISKKLAHNIVQKAERDKNQENNIHDKELYVAKLKDEAEDMEHRLQVLNLIRFVDSKLDDADDLIVQRKIEQSIDVVKAAWEQYENIPVDRNSRVMRLIETRKDEILVTSEKTLLSIWDQHIYLQGTSLTINKTLPHEPTDLQAAVKCLKHFKQLDRVSIKLWKDLDRIFIRPRTDLSGDFPPSVQVTENSIGFGEEQADRSIKSLFVDLECIIRFLSTNLEPDLVRSISHAMIPVFARIKEEWMDGAVSCSLSNVREYQKTLSIVNEFCDRLHELNWPGVDTLTDWVLNASKLWLAKRREHFLDVVRNTMALGIGPRQAVEHVETRLLREEETNGLAATGNVVDNEWDAWDSDGADEHPPQTSKSENDQRPVSNRHSLEEERRHTETVTSPVHETETDENWGWGDDDDIIIDDQIENNEQSTAASAKLSSDPQASSVREVTMSETYYTTSLPQSLMKAVTEIYEEGAELLKPEYAEVPISPAAPALFGLPTLVLAIYRALGTLYYTTNDVGNMFLYNDTIWLGDQLNDFIKAWKARDDLPARTRGLLKLDPEIKVLQSFGRRAYTNELNGQRGVINDLMGGTQNFFQDASSDEEELERRIGMIIDHIRAKSKAWEQVLSRSALRSATGALVNTVATRIISDVFDMSSMSATEASSAATIINLVESLDNLFTDAQTDDSLSSSVANTTIEGPPPMTAQFADRWFKMKYLGQILSSNLNDMHYLWFESELSLYFTAEEVVDLIELSFESNARARNEIKQIRDNPHPIEESH